VFQIYFASDRSKVEKCIVEIEKELDKLKKNPLSKEHLRRLQRMVMGQLAIFSDNNESRMMYAGKDVLKDGKIESLNDICNQIAAVSDDMLCEIANKLLNNFSFLMHY
jgi:predicted Zn-dependent peptidase